MTTLPTICNNRIRNISETPSISLWGEHQEGQEAQEDPEVPAILTEDQERYPLLISFPSNLQEILNLQVSHHSSSMATERKLMRSSENYEST